MCSWATRCLIIQPFYFVFSLLSIPITSLVIFFFLSFLNYYIYTSGKAHDSYEGLVSNVRFGDETLKKKIYIWTRDLPLRPVSEEVRFPGCRWASSRTVGAPRGGWAGCTLRCGRWALWDWLPDEERWMNR